MTRTLELKINCGEKTCASKPGEFCRFFLHSFGTPSCFLFGTLWDDEDGWVRRHEDCLAIELPEKQGQGPSQKST